MSLQWKRSFFKNKCISILQLLQLTSEIRLLWLVCLYVWFSFLFFLLVWVWQQLGSMRVPVWPCPSDNWLAGIVVMSWLGGSWGLFEHGRDHRLWTHFSLDVWDHGEAKGADWWRLEVWQWDQETQSPPACPSQPKGKWLSILGVHVGQSLAERGGLCALCV